MANAQGSGSSWLHLLMWSLKLDFEFLFRIGNIPGVHKARFIFLKYFSYMTRVLFRGQPGPYSSRIADRLYYYNDPNGLASLQRVYCGSYRLQNYVPQNATIIDVGANIGQFTHFSRCYLGAKRIISIEPERRSFELLTNNALSPTDCLNVAVSCRTGNVTFYVSQESSQLSSYVPDDRIDYSGKYVVPTQTLDTVVKDLDVGHIDLLKIDTEGSELDVLKSAEAVLLKTDTILIEMSIFRESAGNLFQTGSFLEERGFFLVELFFGSSRTPRDVDAIFMKR